MKKKIVFLVVIIVLLSGGIYKFYQAKFAPAIYSGTIEATLVDISAQISSRVDAYNIKEGQQVEENQSLVQLSCEDVRISLDLANKDWIRAQKLRKEGSVSQESFEHTQNRFEDLRIKKSWCEINSPLKGTILHTYKEKGEFAMIGQKLLTIADLTKLWSYIYLSAADMKRVQLGKEFNAYLPQLDQKIKVKVIVINAEAEFTPKNIQTREERERLVYGVKVELLGDVKKIFPGMNLEVELDD